MVTLNTPNIPADERWKRVQSNTMPQIANLARDGRVRFFTYSEIELETLMGTLCPCSIIDDCLSGVEIDRVPSAIERSRFQQMSMEEFCLRDTRIRFFRWLLSLDDKDLAKRPKFLAMFSPFERQNIELLGRFREICRNLSEKHFPDAFHLWTAEVNQLDYFLTADAKFINAITASSRIALSTHPICPADFIDKMAPVAGT